LAAAEEDLLRLPFEVLAANLRHFPMAKIPTSPDPGDVSGNVSRNISGNVSGEAGGSVGGSVGDGAGGGAGEVSPKGGPGGDPSELDAVGPTRNCSQCPSPHCKPPTPFLPREMPPL